MRIGIDARLYNQTGVGRYLRNLIESLGKIDNENDYLVYLRKEEFDNFILPGKNWQKKLLDIKWHTIQEQLLVPFQLLKDNLDIVHFPYFNVPIFYPKKYLLTIHDLIVDHFDTGRASTLPPVLFKTKRLGYKITTAIGISRAKLITVISNTTKQELLDHYHPDEAIISITYDALDDQFLEKVRTHRPKKYFTYPYLLYVGNAYPHKNLERLVKAFNILKDKKNLHLVLAGDDQYFYPRLKQFVDKMKLSSLVTFFGNANDEQLVNLYSFCSVLVFPSHMEGFGLPNLEAIACNKLPVVSDIPAFREIWGDNLIFFDPNNEDDIAEKLNYALLLPTSKYQKKVEIAAQRLRNFSWEKTAEKTLEIYKRIGKSNN